MPIYEYKCQSCEQLIEVMQRMSDDPLTTCKNCGGDLKKQISAPAFQFKGTGWYVTDYADKGKGTKDTGKESKKSSGGEDSSSGNDSSSSTESGSKKTSSDSSSSKSSSSEGSSSKTSSTKKDS